MRVEYWFWLSRLAARVNPVRKQLLDRRGDYDVVTVLTHYGKQITDGGCRLSIFYTEEPRLLRFFFLPN